MESGGLIRIKSEPPDDYPRSSEISVYSASSQPNDVISNGGDSTASEANFTIAEESDVSEGCNSDATVPVGENRNFTCLLCDTVFKSRDDLRQHLRVIHSSVSLNVQSTSALTSTSRDLFSTYVNFRYTCSTCGARLKTFKNYLSHSMSHRGRGSLHGQFTEERLSAIIGSCGRQSINEYLNSEENYLGSFTCEGCQAVFTQRDAYAMHMMMRAMKETCTPPVVYSRSLDASGEIKRTDVSPTDSVPADSVSPPTQAGVSRTLAMSSPREGGAGKQRCLEEVTSQVEQDEYLKTVLDKVFLKQENNTATTRGERSLLENKNLCIFCGTSFLDQDSLAMHVMSDHATQMFASDSQKASKRIQQQGHKDYNHWRHSSNMFGFACKVCGEHFLTRDNLAMHVISHTQSESITSESTLRGSVKRNRDLNGDIGEHSPVFKLMRKSSENGVHTIGQSSESLESSTMSPTQSGSHVDDFHYPCKLCSVHFSTKQEYTDHIQTVHVNPHNRDQFGLEKTDDLWLSENNEQKVGGQNLTRSNSFCVDDSARKSASPTRPHSVDQIANMRSRAVHSLNSQVRSQSYPGNVSKSKVSPSETSTSRLDPRQREGKHNHYTRSAGNMEALSSQERKIMYSVFGNLLDKSGKISEQSLNPETSSKRSHPSTNTGQLYLSSCQPRTGTDVSASSSSQSHSAPYFLERSKSRSETTSERDEKRLTPNKSGTAMCKFCEIIFLNKAIYYLHMGLHNVNNPWQCNVCGKTCENAIDFTAHVIHM